MRLRRLTASNVFSLGTVDIDLDKRGLVLVTGHSNDEGGANGAGKSSLANKAILWGLFGQTAGGLRADEVVNIHTAPPCFVEITFQGSDGKDYTTKRSRKPASLEFHCGPERLTQRNEKETQELINRALGRNYETFVYSDFFGQGREDNFLSVSPKDQKAVLERILPIAQLSKWSDSSSHFKSSVAAMIQEEERAISFLKGGVEKLKASFELQFKRSSEWDTQHKQAIRNYEEKIASYETSHKIALERIQSKSDQLVNMTVPPDLSAELTDAYKLLELHRATHAQAHLVHLKWREEVVRWSQATSSKHPENCSYCGQRLREEILDSYKNAAYKAQDKFTNARIAVEQASKAETHWVEQVGLADTEYRRLSNLVEQRQATLVSRTTLEKEIEKDKVSIGADNCQGWKSDLDRLKKEINPYLLDSDQAERELKIEQDKVKARSSTLVNLVQERDRLAFWQNAFGKDLKVFLLDKVCPFLTERASKHLEGLGNSQIKIIFSTTKQLKSGEDRDEFSVVVNSSSGGGAFDSLSGGEQQIVSFAVGLALADLAESQAVGISKILILDEPFMSLDQRNAENLIHYLGELSSRRETILLISNEESLKSLIPSNIHVEKTNGVTTIK